MMTDNLNKAQAAEERVRSLTEELGAVTSDRDAAAAAHEAEVKRLHKQHRAELRDLKKKARQELARVVEQHAKEVQRLTREHAYRMEQLVSQRSPELNTDPSHVSTTTLAGYAVYEPDTSI